MFYWNVVWKTCIHHEIALFWLICVCVMYRVYEYMPVCLDERVCPSQ